MADGLKKGVEKICAIPAGIERRYLIRREVLSAAG